MICPPLGDFLLKLRPKLTNEAVPSVYAAKLRWVMVDYCKANGLDPRKVALRPSDLLHIFTVMGFRKVPGADLPADCLKVGSSGVHEAILRRDHAHNGTLQEPLLKPPSCVKARSMQRRTPNRS